MKPLGRVAVLGAGTMGSRIAAHFANAGVPVLLLDLVLPDQGDRNAAARRGIESAFSQKPGAFFTPDTRRLITPGNFEDDLAGIRDCDWIIEAVAEDLAIKRALFERVEAARRQGSIVSTNTSGIPLARIAEGFGEDLRRHFLGAHFFNPPRYLHLVELIPGPETLPEVWDFVAQFCDLRLGKGVVRSKDTPNFIANRIGAFFGATVHKITVEDDYSIEEVDALTGPAIGLPKSASFRLLDLIGLDIWAQVLRNLYEAARDDPWRERFVLPDFLAKLLERGWLGEKRGQGCYRRVGTGAGQQILALDRKTLEYHPARKARFASLEAAGNIENLPERLRRLVNAPDRAGSFLWKLLSDVFIYSASMIPEIADRPVEIDRAMRWGYAFSLGPFELWDALGVAETARRIEAEGRAIPAAVERMLASGAKSFYRPADAGGWPRTEYFDLAATAYREVEPRPGILALPELKRARGVVRSNPEASLVDLGDGVLCLEFHSKMNVLGEDAVSMIPCAVEEAARNFEALIIANQGEHFSAGASLTPLLLSAQEGKWSELEAAVRRFQSAMMDLKYAPKPVVAAPFGMTLGGGCEVVLHCARAQASAELYMGLVETGVGLIPAGGGCKEMIARGTDLKCAFELIACGKVSTSAADARGLGLLRPADGVSMNPERLIGDAKRAALALAPGYAPGAPRTGILVEGEAGFTLLKDGVYLARENGSISDYDAAIGEKLAHVLCGGRLTGRQPVSEQYLLDLEREAFLSLLGEPKTQERIEHMLKTGKPLRN